MDKATLEWLDSLKKSSRTTYGSFWSYFLEFTGMTGDEILESKRKDEKYEWEKRVLEFKRWLVEECIRKHTRKKPPSEQEHLSEGSAATATNVVRGFFSFHREDLKFRPIESKHIDEAEPKYEDYRFSIDDLKKMSDVADLTEQYVIVVGKSFGLRAGDFLELTRGDLEAYIDREVPISIGQYQTEKESVPAYPFIDRDAKPVIKLMLEKMDREGKRSPNNRMLDYKSTIELTRVLRRVAERAGIKQGNKRIRFHCLRKFLTDRLSSFMSESKWKQVVGKKISEDTYVSPDLLQKDYERAVGETCFTRPFIISKEDVRKEVASALKEAAEGISVEDLLKPIADRHGIKVEFLKKNLLQASKRMEKEENVEDDCQKLIEPKDLEQYLKNGWRFIAQVNGKLVVEK